MAVPAIAALLVLASLASPHHRAALLCAIAIFLWATGSLSEAVTSLAFFSAALLAGIAPPAVVFSGFSSSAFWLVVSGLILGAAARETGLAVQLAARATPVLDGPYRRALGGVVLLGVALAFVVPSAMGRIALLLPVLEALADARGHARGSRAREGLLLAGVLGTYLPSSAILPANVPNNVLSGVAEAVLGSAPGYLQYLRIHFPVLGAAKALLVWAVLAVAYGKEARCGPAQRRPASPTSTGGRRLAVVLLATTGLFATDAWHHVPSAWIAMAAAVACLLPPLEILPRGAIGRLSFEPALFVAGVMGLGAVIVHVGLGGALAAGAAPLLGLSPGAPAASWLRIGALATVVGLFTTLPGVPAVLTPLTDGLAAASSLGAQAVLAAQVLGFSTPLLPYQAPPLALAMETELSRRALTRMTLATAAATILLLWPLDALWLSTLRWLAAG